VVAAWLNGHRTPVLEVAQNYNYLRLYTKGDAAPQVNPAFRPQVWVDEPLGAGVLVGYDLPTDEFRPGDTMNLALYLRLVRDAAAQSAPEDLIVDWVAPDGQVVERQELYAAERAQGEHTVRLMAPFAVFEYTMPGRYVIEVYPAGDDSNRMRLAVGKVTNSRRLPKLKIAHRRDVSVGEDLVRFVGYGVRPSERVGSGGKVTVDLFWEAQRPVDRDYTVFVHLLGGYNPATGGPVWAQDDGYPLDGGHPTTRWLPGRTIADRHTLVLPAEIPSGVYSIEVGLYDALTGERLSVVDSDQDRILIGEVQITQ
jgi:hypothetical protein